MRVLVLTHRLPFPPDRGDRLRAFHILGRLQAFSDVELVSLVHSPEEADCRRELAARGIRVDVATVPRLWNLVRGGLALAGSQPLTHRLLDAPALGRALAVAARRQPDVILAYCSGMARFALEPPLAGIPFVIDFVDIDSMKWSALAERTAGPLGWVYAREARTLSRFEAAAACRASAAIVVNDRERDALVRLAPEARIHIVPNGVDVERLAPRGAPAERRDVVFCGVMDYPPNEEGAVWMVRRVWPAVRARYPDARLKLVGSNPTTRVRALADPAAAIEVTGYVDDVRPHLWSAAVSVAPLLTARGIQNKVLEAVAAGLPAVITQAVAGGLPAPVLPACTVADAPETFAAAVLALLDLPPAERRARAARADLTPLAWDRTLAPLQAILEGACGRRAGSRFSNCRGGSPGKTLRL